MNTSPTPPLAGGRRRSHSRSAAASNQERRCAGSEGVERGLSDLRSSNRRCDPNKRAAVQVWTGVGFAGWSSRGETLIVPLISVLACAGRFGRSALSPLRPGPGDRKAAVRRPPRPPTCRRCRPRSSTTRLAIGGDDVKAREVEHPAQRRCAGQRPRPLSLRGRQRRRHVGRRPAHRPRPAAAARHAGDPQRNDRRATSSIGSRSPRSRSAPSTIHDLELPALARSRPWRRRPDRDRRARPSSG